MDTQKQQKKQLPVQQRDLTIIMKISEYIAMMTERFNVTGLLK